VDDSKGVGAGLGDDKGEVVGCEDEVGISDLVGFAVGFSVGDSVFAGVCSLFAAITESHWRRKAKIARRARLPQSIRFNRNIISKLFLSRYRVIEVFVVAFF